MKRLSALLLALPLAACSLDGFELPHLASTFDSTRPDTQPLKSSIRSVPQPSVAALSSMTVSSLMDGSTQTFTVRPFGNGVRVRESDGCIWTRAGDWFSPSDSWANCGESRNWHTGQATVRQLDSPYPLKVGSVGRYERSAVSHTGRSYDRQTRCEVTDAVEVLRPGKAATPAYVVVCDDSRRVRTTWYAPDEGPIAYREVNHRKGVEVAWLRND